MTGKMEHDTIVEDRSIVKFAFLRDSVDRNS